MICRSARLVFPADDGRPDLYSDFSQFESMHREFSLDLKFSDCNIFTDESDVIKIPAVVERCAAVVTNDIRMCCTAESSYFNKLLF